jgi:hypothetical protein
LPAAFLIFWFFVFGKPIADWICGGLSGFLLLAM